MTQRFMAPKFPLMAITVVGSYPLSPPREKVMKAYFQKKDPYLPTIEESIMAQIEAGVEILSDGQTRESMVNIFASRIAGIRMKGKPVVFSALRFRGPITLTDQKFALKTIEELKKKSEGEERRTVHLKGIITGPHTMSLSVTDNHYHNPRELAFAFARILNQEAKALQEVVPIIQFDEPFFSVDFPDYAEELIAECVKGLNVPVALHACGDVSGIFSRLIELPVSILDHEFAVNPGLIDVVKEYDFPQMLGFGAVRSDDVRVESVKEIQSSLRKAISYFGAEKLMVDPDCGLRHLTPKSAFQKLHNLRIARDNVLKEEGLI